MAVRRRQEGIFVPVEIAVPVSVPFPISVLFSFLVPIFILLSFAFSVLALGLGSMPLEVVGSVDIAVFSGRHGESCHARQPTLEVGRRVRLRLPGCGKMQSSRTVGAAQSGSSEMLVELVQLGANQGRLV